MSINNDGYIVKQKLNMHFIHQIHMKTKKYYIDNSKKFLFKKLNMDVIIFRVILN